jgi:hypothetical protein
MRLVTTVVALAGLASLLLLASACGGAASPQVAAIGTTTTQSSPGQRGTVGSGSPAIASGGTSGSAGTPSGNASRMTFALVRGSVGQMTKFAACVRSHGEPSFPDPNAQGQFSMSAVTAGGIDPRSPQFGQALQACEKDLPKSGPAALSPAAQAKARQQALAFSACMRSHGVPNFPDPTPGGATQIRGIDPQSPQYKTATTACQKYLGKGSKLGPGAGQ